MIPHEFIYAGAVVLWIAGFVWTIDFVDVPEDASSNLKAAGCLTWGALLVILTGVVYLLAAGAMRYAI